MRIERVAVVIVTYNATAYMPELFESLAGTVCDRQWGVIVVDNASTDDTVKKISDFPGLARAWPRAGRLKIKDCTIIENKTNVGFATGNNIGIRRALENGADAVVLLNHDTVVDPSWLSAMIAAAESDPAIGAVQARLMLAQDREKVNSIGNAIHFLGFGYSVGNGRQLSTHNSQLLTQDITYASGAAVLYTKQALEDVGLLDDWLFMYHEDLEMGWRLWRAGWRSVLAPAAIVYHKYSFSKSIQKYYYMERNRLAVLAMHYSLWTLLLIAPALIVMELGLWLFAFRSGWWREKARAYKALLSRDTWRHIRETRARLRSITRVRERDVVRRFTGTIGYQEIDNAILRYIVNPVFAAYWFVVRRLIL